MGVSEMGRYARVERERRFLLPGIPATTPADAEVRGVEDRYLDGTRLRLRVLRREGLDPVFKLGQKVRPDPRQPSTVAHTSVYLDPAEFELLRGLPGHELTKTRTVWEWGDHLLAVDVFTDRLEGLVMAEVDGADSEGPQEVLPELPFRWLAEVTDDERYTGGALARTDRAALRGLLREHDPGP